MGIIKKLKGRELVGWALSPETDVFPITATSAVYDGNNNNLDLIIYSLKLSIAAAALTGGGSSSSSGVATVTYLAFRGAIDDDDAKSNLKQNSYFNPPDGWSNSSNVTLGDDEVLYMTTARKLGDTWLTWTEDGNEVVWATPIRIGAGSSTDDTGADDDKYNYAYLRANGSAPTYSSEVTVEQIEKASDKSTEDITYGVNYLTGEIVTCTLSTLGVWTDHPFGVTESVPDEYILIFKRNEDTDSWDKLTIVLWSHYGDHGLDGDGIEYIFYRGTVAPTSDNETQWPPSWTSDAEFQNPDYYRTSSGWKDNPYDLTDFAGYKLWVCTRKKSAATLKWGAFCDPALWSYCQMDIVSSGALDFDNDSMSIPINDSNNNSKFCESAVAHIYKGTGEVTINSLTCNGLFYEDTLINATPTWVTISDTTKVTVNLPEDTLTNIKGKTYLLKFTATSSEEGITPRVGYIKIIGLNTGTDGASYLLLTDSKIIKKGVGLLAGTNYPSTITPTLLIAKGADDPIVYKVTNANFPSNFKIFYGKDGGTTVLLTEDSFSTMGVENYFTVLLVDSLNSQVILEETILAYDDGVLGISATQYSILVTSSNVTSDALSRKTSGTFTVKATRQYGSDAVKNLTNNKFTCTEDDTELTATLSASMSHTLGTDTSITLTENSSVYTGIVNVNSIGKTIRIDLKVGASSTLVASAIIPVSSLSTSTLTLNYTTLNRVEIAEDGYDTTTAFYNGKTADSSGGSLNGIYHLDIIIYRKTDDMSNWGTYLCIADCECTPSEIPSKTDYFKKMDYTFAEVVNYLVADTAWITSISTKLVVLYDDNNTIVGGMTSGKYVPTEVAETTENTNGIRIWAGPISDGNIATAPLTIDNNGNIKTSSLVVTKDVKNDYDTVTASNDNKLMWLTTWGNARIIAGKSSIKGLSDGISIDDSDPVILMRRPSITLGNENDFFVLAPLLLVNTEAGEKVNFTSKSFRYYNADDPFNIAWASLRNVTVYYESVSNTYRSEARTGAGMVPDGCYLDTDVFIGNGAWGSSSGEYTVHKANYFYIKDGELLESGLLYYNLTVYETTIAENEEPRALLNTHTVESLDTIKTMYLGSEIILNINTATDLWLRLDENTLNDDTLTSFK